MIQTISLEMNRTDVIRRLHAAFPELGPLPEESVKTMQEHEDAMAMADVISLGAEVEVRWRHYFPHLYDVFLKNTPYSELSDQSKKLLTDHCSREEKHLIPRLKLTEYCGIPKGKDKYYEFAFAPCHNPAILAYEIQLLRRLQLIPTNYKHSLHLTIGGLGASFKAGMILMALELIGFSSKERIISACDPDDPMRVHRALTWGRKGRAGMRERKPTDVIPLTLGKSVGIELRTLELPTDERASAILFMAAHKLAVCATSSDPRHMKHWELIVGELINLGRDHHLDVTTNWGRPYEDPDLWLCFAKCLDQFDTKELIRLINEISLEYA
jgi:hypothetical protein